MNVFNLEMENLEILNYFYSMDMPEEQFLFQNFYSKFEHMSDNGEAIWSQIGTSYLAWGQRREG